MTFKCVIGMRGAGRCVLTAALPCGFRDNYGAIGLLDWLHGTDVNYRRHVAAMAKAA